MCNDRIVKRNYELSEIDIFYCATNIKHGMDMKLTRTRTNFVVLTVSSCHDIQKVSYC